MIVGSWGCIEKLVELAGQTECGSDGWSADQWDPAFFIGMKNRETGETGERVLPSYINGEVALAWFTLGSIVEGFNARWRITCLVIPATLVGVMIH